MPVVFVVAVGRLVAPSHTVDVRLALTQADNYSASHFRLVVAWIVVSTLVSCCAAGLWAVPPAWLLSTVDRLPTAFRPSGVGLARRVPLLPGSAWTETFSYDPEKVTLVGVRLTDGSYLEGSLGDYNPSLEETTDRDIVLTAPIAYASAGAPASEWAGIGQVIVSAREIQLIVVTQFDDQAALVASMRAGSLAP